MLERGWEREAKDGDSGKRAREKKRGKTGENGEGETEGE